MCPEAVLGGTCRVYITEEVGIIRNVMDDLAEGSADSPLAVGRPSQSGVGVDRGLGE